MMDALEILYLYIQGKINFEEYLMLMADGDEEVVNEFLKNKGIEK